MRLAGGQKVPLSASAARCSPREGQHGRSHVCAPPTRRHAPAPRRTASPPVPAGRIQLAPPTPPPVPPAPPPGHFQILSTGDMPILAFRLKPGKER